MPEIFGAALMGGGSGPSYAVIDVTYPAGAVCTCTNGVRTMQAKDSSGHWMFSIPKAGEWTVVAEQGTKSKVETITVEEAKVYSVTLSFALYIIKDGRVVEPFTVKKYHGIRWNTISDTDIYMEYYDPGGVYAAIALEPVVDLTGYSSLIITAKNLSSSATGYLGVLNKSNLSNIDLYNQWHKAKTSFASGTSKRETLLDVSEFVGEQTIGIGSAAGPGTNVTLHIYELRLE